EAAIAFTVADVVTAPTPSVPFDRLVSRFGVMFFHDPLAAFHNLFRWLAPGGRFAFAVWGPLADNPWVTTVRKVGAEVLDLPPSHPEAPGPFRYADVDKLLTLLDQTGFEQLAVVDFREAIAIGGGLSAPLAASFALAAFSSFGEMLERA